ncbi:MAG: nicotinate (nicotinamide) nucleotide adenylyltransferase [Patescibacteria group bacterium]|nr:nicotinate (nicotinamide) nucleotide adenylyltransferase [Patescibacteria group bacterium]
MKNILVFGGSFNPPHNGHLAVIKKALKKTGLKKIILMPSGLQTLKKNYDMAPMKDRLAMAEILTKLDPRIEIADIEIKKSYQRKKSYTAETIKELKKQYHQTKIYWVIGQDSFEEILAGKWKVGLEIFDQADFIVATRPSLKKVPKNVLAKIQIIKMNCPISSTMIRKFLRQGKSIKKLVPMEILKYIQNKKLYTQGYARIKQARS